MAFMNKSMQVKEFLQNAISLKVSEQERITKYSLLADLCAEINFYGKSAFYRRVAAMQCVAPQLEQTNWNKCYCLLQGHFKVTVLKFTRIPESHLIIQMIRPVNLEGLKYMAYLLMRMHKHLTDGEEKEACTSLEWYNSKNADMFEFTDKSYHLYTYTTFPLPVSPRPLTDHLQPSILNTSQSKASVFLFMPLSYQSAQNKHQHIDFKWCVDKPAEFRILPQIDETGNALFGKCETTANE